MTNVTMPPIFPASLLPAAALDLPGRLLLGSAPGRLEYGSLGTVDLDLESLARDHAITDLVCLVEEEELHALGITELLERPSAHGIRLHHVPIRDGGVPEDPAAMDGITGLVLGLLRDRHGVYVHCWAGLGRTGTVATCCLIAHGHSAWEALCRVRRTRPGAVETRRQELFIRDYAAWRRA